MSNQSTKLHFVYMIQVKTGALYVGETWNLHHRIKEHSGIYKSNQSAFVKKRGYKILCYYELLNSTELGKRREREIKNWTTELGITDKGGKIKRAYKEYLVNNMPIWKLNIGLEYNTLYLWPNEIYDKIKSSIQNGENDFTPLSPKDWFDTIN